MSIVSTMNAIDALKSRRTIRQYDATYTIPPEHLNQLIEIALDSPTGCNAQELDLVVLTNRAKIDAALKITFDSWPAEKRANWNKRKETYGVANVVSCDAPCIFFFVVNERAADLPFADIDAGIMTMAVMAAARAFGYHTMCLGALQWGDKAGLEAFLGIPAGKLAMALAIGKPVDGPLIIAEKQRLAKARFID
jgi:nitroreductase